MKKITPSLIATHDPAEYEWTGENPIPVCYCYGMGVDSTAMLEGMAKHGIEVNIPGEPSFRCYRPDLITFADTGSEARPRPHPRPGVPRVGGLPGGLPAIALRHDPRQHARQRDDAELGVSHEKLLAPLEGRSAGHLVTPMAADC